MRAERSTRLPPFRLERYFAQHEFTARYLLSSSDCEGLALNELLALRDAQTGALWDALRLGYTESLGLPLLRAEIAELYEGISADEILVVAPEEGILIAMSCLLSPGDEVICTFPGYQSLYQLAQSLGCRVILWQADESQGWRFDPVFLEATLSPRTRLVVCNFPHNPTGALPSQEDWQRIVSLVQARGAYLFSDEMYRLLELHPKDRLPSAVEHYERAIALAGMSKVFGLAGLRIGWLATRDKSLYAELCAYKDYTTICSSTPSEILALIALRARATILAQHRERILRHLALLEPFMRQHAETFAWTPPKAGTICFPRLVRGGSEAFCAAAVREAGIMLLPSTVFDYGDAHVRLGLGRRDFPEVLDELVSWLDGCQSTTKT
jgi:aspartate/methionine/tyrosine aminotransferase